MTHNEYKPAENTADLKNNAEDKQDKRAWTNRAGDWKTYAAAAGATLAMAANASADIVYSGPVDVTVSVPVSGNNVSVQPFTVANYHESLGIANQTHHGSQVASAVLFGSIGLAASFFPFGTPFLYRYNAGQRITGTGLSFRGGFCSAPRAGGEL